MEQATFGSGCFWCTEAIFQNLNGVSKIVSGYMGGEKPNPTYEEICRGDTGHAEVTQIDFDSDVISYNELLLVFFKTHDPTSLNKQGADIGTQYRSVVFYHNQDQKQQTQLMIDKLERDLVYNKPIVTEIAPISEFYSAEEYHQNYYNQHLNQSYCSFVIQPKLNKFIQEFRDKLKTKIL